LADGGQRQDWRRIFFPEKIMAFWGKASGSANICARVQLRIIPDYNGGRLVVRLSELSRHQQATVTAVEGRGEGDPIARRLGELGFVPGEPVRLITTGPWGQEPLLVQVGFTRFALRRSEAERVLVEQVA
jgi:ferrous iron transport protein A